MMMPSRQPGISLTQFTNTYVPFALLIVLALVLPETTPNLDRYRTIFTIWATIVLLIPALCLHPFSDASDGIHNYWHLFWTFSCLAFLFHFYWAVFVIFKGVHGTFVGQGNLIAATNFLLTAWWGTDVVLSWFVASCPTWLRWERAGAHLFVFLIFSVTTLVLRPTAITKVLGLALTIAVAGSLAIWLIVRDSAPAGGELSEAK
jgi:hypothetical protein